MKLRQGTKPEDTIFFKDSSRDRNFNDKSPPSMKQPNSLLDQISAYKPDDKKSNGSSIAPEIKPFSHKNIGINSRNRRVDATLRAYQLLENSLINQSGNPNHL